MMPTAIALFSLAVLLGIALVVLGVRRRRGSLLLSLGHVAAAVAGLVFLGREIIDGPVRMLYNNAALLFVLTLLGASVLLGLRVSARGFRSPPPMLVVGLHGALAVTGLALLVLGYNRYTG